MSISGPSLSTMLQTLSSIPNVSGSGIPVSTYASTEQQVLTTEMESVPNQQLSALNQTTKALSSVDSVLQQLQSATQVLASSNTWSVNDVTSSNTQAFTVAGGSGAPVGDFAVSVLGLAEHQVDVASVGQTTATGASTFTGGTFYITSSATSTAIAITVTANESLSDIVSSVNAQTANTNVEAFILGNNQLAFESTLSGASNGFTLTDATGGNFISTQTAVTLTQSPLDAQIMLGGVTVTSSSDSFGNVIPGVTLTAVATGTGQLSVATDASAALTSVKNWMSSYNNVVDALHADTMYVPASNTAAAQIGPLMGDPVAGGLLSQLPNAINQLTSATGTFQSLASVGIVVDPNNGHLEFQSSAGFTIGGKTVGATLQDGETIFKNAVQSNPSAVQSMFGVVQGTTLQSVIPETGILGNVNNVLNQYVGFGFNPGMIANEKTSIQTQTDSINRYITQLNQMISDRVATFTAQLNQLNASLEKSQSQMKTLSAMIQSQSGNNSSSSSGNA